MIKRDGRSEIEAAERFGERRSIVLILFTLAFAAFALSWMLQLHDTTPDSSSLMRQWRGAAPWAVWGITVLVATFSPRWARPTKAQIGVLNDELTLVHRNIARSAGYWLLLAGLALLLILEATGADIRLALIAVATCGIAVPSLVFSLLQSRSARDE